MGRLNPRRENKIQGKNRDRERGKIENVTERRKILARKRRRRGRAERRLRQSERMNRAHARGREVAVATHNVRTMAVDGKHGVGRALDVLSVYDRLGCDVIGLRQTRRGGHSAFSQAGYLVYCSGECGGENGGKKGQGGVGLAVRTPITRAAHSPEFISDRLLKVTLELRGQAKAVTFVVAYAPTEIQNANNNKHAFWTSLDRVVEEVPKHEQLFVLMDANARTGRREKGQVGSKDSKILGAYGRDTLNDNGELLLSFANNHDLALVNTFFSTPKGGISHTFNGRGKKRIDYILTRQRDRKLVRNVTVHPQPSFLPISGHNIVSAPVKLLGHFSRNHRLRTPAKPPVDRRRLVADPQLRQEVATTVGRHLRENPPGDSNVDDVDAVFAAPIMRTAELMIPSQERRRTGRGWNGDARTEAELQAATDAMHTA